MTSASGTRPIVDQQAFETAEEFLGTLTPRNASWGEDPSSWIFRGHADSSWRLAAKAYRIESRPYESFGVKLPLAENNPEWSAYAHAEKDLLERFRSALDRAGLAIPTKLPASEPHATEYTSNADTQPDAVPLLALAQHFGIPTKLLDWTRQARFAAYFASSVAAKTCSENASLAVWALRLDFVDALQRRSVAQTALTVQTAPASSNPNLHAQQGLFTRVEGEGAHRLTVDEFVVLAAEDAETRDFRRSDAQRGRDPNLIPRPLMRCLRLPQREAPRLLRLLAYDGVTGATMFPGYAGVVRGLKEQMLWDRPVAGRQEQ